jgi:predicted kinase
MAGSQSEDGRRHYDAPAHGAKRVVMSGYPGSGKSTLAAALAERLGFCLISKDAMLMTLYTAFQFGPGDAAASLRTGAAAWAVFWMQAAASPRAVLDSNIKPADPHEMEALRSLGGALAEVRCDCPADVAKARFAARARIGHPAQRHTELDDQRLALYDRPIGLGGLVTVDTTAPVDLDRVTAQVRSILGA